MEGFGEGGVLEEMRLAAVFVSCEGDSCCVIKTFCEKLLSWALGVLAIAEGIDSSKLTPA